MYFDRFDICGAYWLFYSRYHEGQDSYGYRKLSQLVRMNYNPGLSLQRGEFESENQRKIYKKLEGSISMKI